MEPGDPYDRLIAECHKWQLLEGVHEPGQEPRWRLKDPEKLDPNRRDVVMMTRAFVDGHKGHLDRLFDVCLVRFRVGFNQKTIAEAIGAAVAAMPNDESTSHVARDLPKLARSLAEKIPVLDYLAPYLVALEFTGTTDFSKPKEKTDSGNGAGKDAGSGKPPSRTIVDDIDEFFDGFDEFKNDLREAWCEVKKDLDEAAEETRRETAEAKAEVDAAVTRIKKRTRDAWPKLRNRIDSWLADKKDPKP